MAVLSFRDVPNSVLNLLLAIAFFRQSFTSPCKFMLQTHRNVFEAWIQSTHSLSNSCIHAGIEVRSIHAYREIPILADILNQEYNFRSMKHICGEASARYCLYP